VSQKIAQTLVSCSFNKHGLILIIFGKQHRHTSKNYMRIQLSLFFFYLLYLLSNSCNGNDAFWRHCILVKQSSSFSRKHRIIDLQICICQTVRLTRKPGRLQNLATDAGMCVHRTRHMCETSNLRQRINATWASIPENVEAVGQWRKQLCAWMKAK